MTHGKVRGHRGKYPIRLVYASTFRHFDGRFARQHQHVHAPLLEPSNLSQTPILGERLDVGLGLHRHTSRDRPPLQAVCMVRQHGERCERLADPLLNQQGDFGHSLTQIMVHVVFYVALMTVGPMVFAVLD